MVEGAALGVTSVRRSVISVFRSGSPVEALNTAPVTEPRSSGRVAGADAIEPEYPPPPAFETEPAPPD